MVKCCGAERHQWEICNVEMDWLPGVLKCLVIGENPGDATSEYFYNARSRYETDQVVVRHALLHGLKAHGLINEATLDGFKAAGFLFDHAIRCQLPADVVARERQRAMRYASMRVAQADHLRSRIGAAQAVWVMGHLANKGKTTGVRLRWPGFDRHL